MVPPPGTPGSGPNPTLSQQEFELFRRFILASAGIDLAPSKRALVQSRLAKRLRTLHLDSYRAYWERINQPQARQERQIAINLLSTNETYFFREMPHFGWLKHYAEQRLAEDPAPLRVWSAACSTGEEAYSAAMVLAEQLGINERWDIHATDINTRVIPFAQRAIYTVERARHVPPHLWLRYFQRGHDEYEGKIRVKPELARKVSFSNLNLLGCRDFIERDFDVIFLRNVLIYFNEATKVHVLSQLCELLKPGGYLLIGHSETIRQPDLPLVQEATSRYRCQFTRDE
ncbi:MULTISPECIES: CheR family methyltransferase [Aeromonas]|uniref:CheR family methyltransferase n=1 Tax=Aeromonas TaxID=642 RepID=UPI000F51DE98|nr:MULTISPECIES: protein-glutamate O-methyltransferase CheR [Aeromonas]QXC33050.1 protein-glutamate O-methyltransferase CheR [Aeromonas sp. FDAARGOS 1407]RQM60427.1 protein-glutamate O-methyltransferase CheR [Aeromonas enteropelogenes]UCA09870.1 protein-glutamate O-methyltransferase CheR [Aeromonas enteropelogenes]